MSEAWKEKLQEAEEREDAREARMTARWPHVRAQLLAAGFSEATQHPRNFYKETTELTAFYVNLQPEEDCLHIVYGFASTAFTRFAGDEDSLIRYGVLNNTGTLRYAADLQDNAETVAAQMEEVYRAYRNVSKDELLKIIQDRRKAFVKLFAARLKPLGFRKKGNVWTREIMGGLLLRFELQKSLYGDTFAVATRIKRDENQLSWCCFCDSPDGGEPSLDWQTIPEESLETLLEKTERRLREFIDGDREMLVRKGYVTLPCPRRDKGCGECWAEKV